MGAISSLPSPPHSTTFASPTSSHSSFFDNADAIMQEAALQSTFFPLSPPITAPSSPPVHDLLPQTLQSPTVDLSPFSFSLGQQQQQHHIQSQPRSDPQHPSLPTPRVHRLIPSNGPTYGGIEVTVLGSNFHPSVMYNCVFGDVASSSTTRWSDNTLVCVLPPRACPGIVPVSLDGIKIDEEVPSEPVLFTYTDESDRSLYVSNIVEYL